MIFKQTRKQQKHVLVVWLWYGSPRWFWESSFICIYIGTPLSITWCPGWDLCLSSTLRKILWGSKAHLYVGHHVEDSGFEDGNKSLPCFSTGSLEYGGQHTAFLFPCSDTVLVSLCLESWCGKQTWEFSPAFDGTWEHSGLLKYCGNGRGGEEEIDV